MKKRTKVILSILAILLCLVGFMGYGAMKNIPAMCAVEITPATATGLADGTYIGHFEFSRWKSDVNVTVKDGKITSIERLSEPLIPDVSPTLSAAIMEKQSLEVDTVTGATASSKAYLKSVENALNPAQ